MGTIRPGSDSSDYLTILEAITAGDLVALEEYAQLVDDFPEGKDGYLYSRWINHAIGSGSLAVVEWMIAKGVDLNFNDDSGYTVLHTALERTGDDRYAVMRALLTHGADVNAKGVNDWTPAHRAAVENDIAALEVLHEFGADWTIKTAIDEYATPYREAEICGAHSSTLEWLRNHGAS